MASWVNFLCDFHTKFVGVMLYIFPNTNRSTGNNTNRRRHVSPFGGGNNTNRSTMPLWVAFFPNSPIAYSRLCLWKTPYLSLSQRTPPDATSLSTSPSTTPLPSATPLPPVESSPSFHLRQMEALVSPNQPVCETLFRSGLRICSCLVPVVQISVIPDGHSIIRTLDTRLRQRSAVFCSFF